MGVRASIALFAVVAAFVAVVVVGAMTSSGLDLGRPDCVSGGSVAGGETVRGQTLATLGGQRRRPLPPLGEPFEVTYTDCHGDGYKRKLQAFAGVAPELGVYSPDTRDVSLNLDRMIGLAGSPLRPVLFRTDREALRPLPRRCRSARERWYRVTVSGAANPVGVRASDARDRLIDVELEATARVTGRRRFGVPDPRRGDTARVFGSRCPYRPASSGTRIRATRLELPAR